MMRRRRARHAERMETRYEMTAFGSEHNIIFVGTLVNDHKTLCYSDPRTLVGSPTNISRHATFAVCYSALQCGTVYYSVLQCVPSQ